MIEIATLTAAVASMIIVFQTLRRMPKLPEPEYKPSVIAFEVVQLPKAPGLPGYDCKAHKSGFNRRGQ